MYRAYIRETIGDFKTKAEAERAEARGEARQEAIDWQNSQEDMSYGELAEAQAYFTELAEEHGLEEEFKENGII